MTKLCWGKIFILSQQSLGVWSSFTVWSWGFFWPCSLGRGTVSLILSLCCPKSCAFTAYYELLLRGQSEGDDVQIFLTFMPLTDVDAIFPSPASTIRWIQFLDKRHPVKKATTTSHCSSLLCLFSFHLSQVGCLNILRQKQVNLFLPSVPDNIHL